MFKAEMIAPCGLDCNICAHRAPFGELPVVSNYFYYEEITKSAEKKTEKGE